MSTEGISAPSEGFLLGPHCSGLGALMNELRFFFIEGCVSTLCINKRRLGLSHTSPPSHVEDGFYAAPSVLRTASSS